MTSKKRQKIPKIKIECDRACGATKLLEPGEHRTDCAVYLADHPPKPPPKGITSTDELVAPTPRRDPVACVLEDARDHLKLWSPDNDVTGGRELVERLANILRVTHKLLTNYRSERDIARHVIDQMREERYRRTNGIGVY